MVGWNIGRFHFYILIFLLAIFFPSQLDFWADRKETRVFCFACASLWNAFSCLCLKSTKKWIIYCWWIPVGLVKTKVSLTFLEQWETAGWAEEFYSPSSEGRPVSELSSCSVLSPAVMHVRFLAPWKHAGTRSAYDIDRHNAWIRLLFHCLKRSSAAFLPFIETECFLIFQLNLLVVLDRRFFFLF